MVRAWRKVSGHSSTRPMLASAALIAAAGELTRHASPPAGFKAPPLPTWPPAATRRVPLTGAWAAARRSRFALSCMPAGVQQSRLLIAMRQQNTSSSGSSICYSWMAAAEGRAQTRQGAAKRLGQCGPTRQRRQPQASPLTPLQRAPTHCRARAACSASELVCLTSRVGRAARPPHGRMARQAICDLLALVPAAGALHLAWQQVASRPKETADCR